LVRLSDPHRASRLFTFSLQFSGKMVAEEKAGCGYWLFTAPCLPP
jgi:hypothetical protein